MNSSVEICRAVGLQPVNKLPLAEKPEREQMLEMLLSELDGMVYRCRNDEHWTMQFVSAGCKQLTGYRPDELLHNARISYDSITHPHDRERVREEVNTAVLANTTFNIEYRILHADGSIKWVWERGSALSHTPGQPRMIHGFVQDITQRHQHENALSAAEHRYRSIFENANEGIYQTTTSGRYLEVNPALAVIYGYVSPAELVNALDNIGKQLYVDPGRRNEFAELIKRNNTVTNFESEVYRKDHTIIWISENAHVVYGLAGEVLYYEGTVEDITARKQYEQRITHQATHDVLTGLPNRALLSERIETAILNAGKTGSSFAVVFIDLDHFKAVNDTMGHAAGDILIRKVAERLQSCLRDTDMVARIGGDEFVLLLPDIRHDYDFVAQIIERILCEVRKPCSLGEREFIVSCSVGISLHPADGMGADTLLKHADIAMYQAKDCGRNNYQFFTEEFNRIVMANHELEHQLRHAITAKQFAVYYQPIYSPATGRMVKAEALLRWHTKGGSISPSRFIPVAESSGLIEPLGAWVLDTVCQQLADWKARGLAQLPVAINISPRQFNQPDLIDNIKSTLRRYGVSPALLEIEITENCLARDKKQFLHTISEMKALGLVIAIDDFGSGYSNMECLKTMQFSTLKIDRSFIIGVDRENNHRAIYRAIISMAHNLNLKVVAEGVETKPQVDFLRSIGCDLIQGFYYSYPLTVEDFETIYATGDQPA
jgi:diguanylate cyclase (GGDEF)-like protein/PAS domain S-box-containing protein